MTERRMEAYYYSFDSTGCDPVDKILSAVACAGKAYHHTDDWYEQSSPQDDHAGGTPIDWIQNAAIEAAHEIKSLQKALERLVSINEQHNEAVAAIIGRPVGWKDTYLDEARALIKKTNHD